MNASIAAVTTTEAQNFDTLKSQFASHGYVLSRARRVSDGRITFLVTRWETPIAFKTLDDVQVYLSLIVKPVAPATHHG